MTGPLHIPVLAEDIDAVGAALAYAKAGWFVVPVRRGTKDPGSVLGKGWHYQSTRDAELIVAWFAGTDHDLALHVGRSGAVALDVDHPDAMPDALRDAVTAEGVPFQSTRSNNPERGHYMFRQPVGRMIGNSTGTLGGAWGEVRGLNGAIIVAPSTHEKVHEGGRYQWQRFGVVPELPAHLAAALPDATDTTMAATDAAVTRFLDEHVGNDHPGLLNQVCAKFTKKVTAGGSRHDAAVSRTSYAMKEAQAGFYPASVAAERLRELFLASIRKTPGRERAGEWDGILRWAVAQALTDDPAARRAETEARLNARRRELVTLPPGGMSTLPTKKEETVTAQPGPVAAGTKKEETSPPVPDAAIFRGVLGDITRAAEPTTEADPVGVLASLLAFTGVAIGPGPHLQIGNTRHPLLIWPLLFGRTGSGRKGEASHTAQRFYAVADPHSGDYTVTGLSSGEGLIERVRDVRDEDDTGGTEDKRLLVTEPEFSSVMARSKREGNTLAAVLRQAWDGQPLSVLNRSALTASSSHIAIIGHITPAEFRLRLAETEMAGGTYNRFLPIFVERSQRLPLPAGIPNLTVTKLGGELGTRIGTARAKFDFTVRLDGDAESLWCHDIYDEFTEADDEDAAWTEFARRAAPYCLRIGGLYAVLDGREHVNHNDLVAAAALVRYSVASAKFVLDRKHRNPRMDRLRRAVDQAGDSGLTRTDVSTLFGRNRVAKILDELVAELLTDERYEMFQRPTGGRPAECYRRKPVPAQPGMPLSTFVPVVSPS